MTLKVHLHKKQGEVFKSKTRFRVLVAGRRFGKTILALITLLINALSQPESLLWYVAPSYKQAKMISWRLLKRIVPQSTLAKPPNESELSIEFKNGSIIELKGADNEDSLRGTGLNGLVIDEFATIYDNWAVWHEVLRPALTDKKGWCLFIGTPKGKDAFFELYMNGIKGEKDWQSWQFKTADNPYIDPNEVLEAQTTMPERYFKQEYEASFEDFVGLIYPEFDERIHVIDPIYLQDTYPRIGAIDTAVTGTTGVLKVAIDEDDVLYIYDEFYETNQRVSEVSKVIKEQGVKWIIDPEAHKKQVKQSDTEELYTLFDEYKDNGISAQNAQKDVIAGINRVGEYFKTNKIKIFKNCTNLIWEIERYHWAQRKESIKGEIKAEPYKKDDHLMDCLRYLIMSRTRGADLTQKEELNPHSAWGRMMLRRQNKEEFHYERQS